jgi:site-specific DNA-methyltransferase (adenine-specific)
MIEIDKVHCLDCLAGVKQIEEPVSLTIYSPPYNLGIDYGHYKDDLPLDQYAKWQKDLMAAVYEKTRPGGRICINIPPDIGTLKEGKIPLDVLFANLLSMTGWQYRTKIVWYKNQITARTAWGSFASPSNPNLLPSFEYVLVYYKESPKLEGEKSNITIHKDEFVPWTDAHWTIGPASAKELKHPAPYPASMCDRLIKMFSYAGDLVLDPFAGSGSTLVAAKQNRRRYLGFEINPEYIKTAEGRLSATTPAVLSPLGSDDQGNVGGV